jgi:hypothetical protein
VAALVATNKAATCGSDSATLSRCIKLKQEVELSYFYITSSIFLLTGCFHSGLKPIQKQQNRRTPKEIAGKYKIEVIVKKEFCLTKTKLEGSRKKNN